MLRVKAATEIPTLKKTLPGNHVYVGRAVANVRRNGLQKMTRTTSQSEIWSVIATRSHMAFLRTSAAGLSIRQSGIANGKQVKPRVLYQIYYVRWSHRSKGMQSPMKNVQKNSKKTWPTMRNPSLEQCTAFVANMLILATLCHINRHTLLIWHMCRGPQ